VLTRPESQAVTLPLLVATLLLRHVRSRLVESDNARLQVAATEATEHRLAMYKASFVALATAIEARDGYTGAHSEETVELVERVAHALALSEEQIAEVKTVALLHDVGKIGIPDSVLHKAGPLDESEWETMRRHPEIGERILRTVPGLDDVARAVRHEHERWDGGGYPDGIAGERIPLSSRIVLVCDAFHAMTSDRPYRKQLPTEEALAELRRCAGTQFDPRVVDALVRVASSTA
jgi:HD-GYP domain-containing protein (c-di-GMP phosphodiesterase class II)